MCQPECMERLRHRRGTRRSGGSRTGREQENEEQKRQDTVRQREKNSGKDILPVKIMTKRTFFSEGAADGSAGKASFLFLRNACGAAWRITCGDRVYVGIFSRHTGK